jgi:hypothetical protein
MTDLGGWLLAMISEIHSAFDNAGLRHPDTFIHCYDYAPPNGIGFEAPIFGIPLSGPWLKPAMDARQVPTDYALRKEIVRILIDTLAATFGEFNSPPDQVYVIQSPGTLNPDSDWDNELHPTGEGFRKLVLALTTATRTKLRVLRTEYTIRRARVAKPSSPWAQPTHAGCPRLAMG